MKFESRKVILEQSLLVRPNYFVVFVIQRPFWLHSDSSVALLDLSENFIFVLFYAEWGKNVLGIVGVYGSACFSFLRILFFFF